MEYSNFLHDKTENIVKNKFSYKTNFNHIGRVEKNKDKSITLKGLKIKFGETRKVRFYTEKYRMSILNFGKTVTGGKLTLQV